MEPRRAAPGPPGWGPRVAAGSGTDAELVYHLAGALGTELQELTRRFGTEAAVGLVPLVVRALELLEKAAVGPAPDSVSHCPLRSRPVGPTGPNPESPQLQVSALQAELELRRLREENEHLRRELRSGPRGECRPRQDQGGLRAPSNPGTNAKITPSSEERALLRQLKEVTDRQRDELRAHSRDLLQRSQETEAVSEGSGRRALDRASGGLGAPPTALLSPRPQLQEQLQRLLLVNAELRHKLAVVQAQLRVAQDRERERELPREGALQSAEEQRQEPERTTPEDPVSTRREQGPIPEFTALALGGHWTGCAVLYSGSSGKHLERCSVIYCPSTVAPLSVRVHPQPRPLSS
jgi:Rab-interacting lysosomal protein